MATATSFKQECPSCEALVPIRDPALVGRKIDCPKCKYRFEVKAPKSKEKDAEEAPAKNGKAGNDKVTTAKDAKTAPAGAKNGKAGAKKGKEDAAAPAKKKKGGGSSMTVILGVGVGLIAVVGLIVAAVCFWPSGDSPKPNPNLKPGANLNNNTDKDDSKDKDEKKETPKTPTPSPSKVADISNLLPNDTETVVSLNVPALLGSAVKTPTLQKPGTFQDVQFSRFLGFPLSNVQRVVLGYIPAKQGYISAWRTTKPINRDQLATGLKLDPQPPVNGLNIHQVKGRLDGLCNFLVKGNQAHDAYYLHVLDDYTLVFASRPVMDQFLADNTKPKYLTEPPADPNPPDPEKKPEGGDNPQPEVKTEGGGQTTEPEKKPEPPAPAIGPFMTVQPLLKRVLDKVENPDKPALVVVGTYGRSFLAKELGQRMLDAIPLPGFGGFTDKVLKKRADPFRDVEVLSFSITAISQGNLTARAALEGRDERSRAKLEETTQFFGTVLPDYIKSTLALDVLGLQPVGDQPPPPPDQPPEPDPNKGRDGSLTLTKEDTTLVLGMELKLKDVSYEFIMGKLYEFLVQMKSHAELADARPRVHELAAALEAYAKDKNAFPRGTADRQGDSNRPIPYPPGARLSWMCELLPYLSGGSYGNLRLDPNASWSERENLLYAQLVVPQFLARTSINQPGQLRYPKIAAPVAGTHFVGMAGVGYDAAEYRADDPAVAKKLGVFGYDRVTRLKDIKDGRENTIVLIQIPTDRLTPWMAGGGATVRGVSDDPLEPSALAPFVSQEPIHEGKRGTFVIMGDGKVRFLSASTSSDVFRALCTINGGDGDKIGNLDQVAPVVPPPEGSPVLKAEPMPPMPMTDSQPMTKTEPPK